MNYPFRLTMSAAAFAAGISGAPSYAQVVPAPSDLATGSIGSIYTPRPADGQTLIGVNVGDTRHQEGSTATATLLGPRSAADVSFANVTTPDRTQLADVAGVTAGPIVVTRANDGGSALGLSIASAAQQPGNTASLGVASGNAPASIGAGGRAVTLPGWSGVPGLPNLPFALSKSGTR